MEDFDANPDTGSEQDPVSLIEAQLEREEAPTEPARNQKPAPEQEDETPDPEDPPAEDEDGEEDEDPDENQEPEPVAETFTVKLDGKEVQVTRDELLNGYQRQADYSRKTAEVAEQRRQAEAIQAGIVQERQHYQTQLEQVAAVLESTLPPPPDPQRLQTDPFGYIQAKEVHEAAVQQLRAILGERQRVEQLNQQQFQAQQGQQLAQAREKLMELLPEWAEPKVAQREQRDVANHLRAIGYGDAEISAAADPRAIVMARESMLYRQMMAQKPTVQQRVANAPRMVRPGSSGPAPDRSKSVIQQIKRSNGRDLDAVARLIEMG